MQARRDFAMDRLALTLENHARHPLAVQLLDLALTHLCQPDAPAIRSASLTTPAAHRRTTGGQHPARQTSTTTGGAGGRAVGVDVRTLDGFCRFFDIGGALQRAGEW